MLPRGSFSQVFELNFYNNMELCELIWPMAPIHAKMCHKVLKLKLLSIQKNPCLNFNMIFKGFFLSLLFQKNYKFGGDFPLY
jgi:hypothetical protein